MGAVLHGGSFAEVSTDLAIIIVFLLANSGSLKRPRYHHRVRVCQWWDLSLTDLANIVVFVPMVDLSLTYLANIVVFVLYIIPPGLWR